MRRISSAPKSALAVAARFAPLYAFGLFCYAREVTYAPIAAQGGQLCWTSNAAGAQITLEPCSKPPLPQEQLFSRIPMWKCHADPYVHINQVLRFSGSSAQLASSSLCVEIGSSQIGAGIVQNNCDGSEKQSFRFPAQTDLAPVAPLEGQIRTTGGLCWTVSGSGSPLGVKQCGSGRADQLFAVSALGPGVQIRSVAGNFCVDVFNGSASDAAVVGDVPSGQTQIFIPSSPADADVPVYLTNMRSRRCLRTDGAEGSVIRQRSCDLGTDEIFSLPSNATAAEPAKPALLASGHTLIQSSEAPALCWTAGSPMQLEPCNAASAAQLWAFDFGQFVTNATGQQLCVGVPADSGSANAELDTCRNTADQLVMPQTDGSIVLGTAFDCIGPVAARTPGILQQRLVSQNCSSFTTRREWRELSDQEKSNYINAVQKLRNITSGGGRRGVYDDLVAIHASAIKYIHGQPLFFPWHRYFIRVYESYLQAIDPTVSLPYWNWAIDGQEPLTDGSIFGPSALSLGTRGEPSDTDHCLRDGFAKDWTSFYDSACVARNYVDGFALYDDTVLTPLVKSSVNFTDFTVPMEGAHNGVHVFAGGVGGDLYYIDMSPNDPLFFLHHAFVDMQWYLWQQAHPDVANDYEGTAANPPGSNNTYAVSTADLMPGFNVPVLAGMSSDGPPGTICVKYEQPSEWIKASPSSETKPYFQQQQQQQGQPGQQGQAHHQRIQRRTDDVGGGGVGGDAQGRSAVGSGRFGTTARKAVQPIPEDWIVGGHLRSGMAAGHGAGPAVRIAGEKGGISGVDDGQGGGGDVGSPSPASADPAAMRCLQRTRQGEQRLRQIAEQFDRELDAFYATHPHASYAEAKQSVLDNWK
ncbi:hypothetical protein DFJ73DRAFT_778937 [Zopfochytrium polystomum]|nr:hypothetical protein DFJ73DRAFT_778937 [Zopfochytrium polystomum]